MYLHILQPKGEWEVRNVAWFSGDRALIIPKFILDHFPRPDPSDPTRKRNWIEYCLAEGRLSHRVYLVTTEMILHASGYDWSTIEVEYGDGRDASPEDHST